ncbi:hypothetical protein [Tunturiibacter psychrotolerans]|uniref:hypothetical protein n=1 Tax=Tunturiibacter psychrotolerans TaxID=3069686 RepID=UPI003D255705
MFDSNQSYCLRLAEVTFPLLLSRPASTAASDAPRSPRREDAQESEDPLNVGPSIYDELHQLFGPSPDQPVAWLSSIQSLAAALELRPDIQSRLAVVTQYTPSKWLLERELQAFNYWPTPPPKHNSDCPTTPDGKPDPYDVARCRAATGLCLSGGGIRSATFNLGILQALARHGRISKLDYLSSVSGGGYIHQFLANWIYKAGSTSTVEGLLDPIPNQPEVSPLGYRATVQPEPLRWLRRHSNYLAPRKGLVSLDTWTIAATWMRNTALNLVILLSTLSCVLLFPHIGSIPFTFVGAHPALFPLLTWMLAIVFLILGSYLSRWLAHLDPPGPRPIFIKLACGSLLGAAVLVAPSIYETIIPEGSIASSAAKAVFHEVEQPTHLHYKGSFQQQTPNAESLEVVIDSSQPVSGSRLSEHWSERPLGLWHGLLNTGASIPILLFACLCGLLLSSVFSAGKIPIQIVSAVGILGIGFAYLLLDGVRLLFFVACFGVPRELIPSLAVTLLPPLLLAVPFVLMEAGLGIVGNRANSGQGEWIARLRAVSFMIGGSWFALNGLALLGPYYVRLLSDYSGASYTVWLGWIATTIAGVLSGRDKRTESGKTSGSPYVRFALELLSEIAPTVFVFGLFFIVAFLFSDNVSWSIVVPNGTSIQREHRFLLLFFGSLAIALFFGWRVDINDFSMHAFYRDRLARCYGGAIDLHRVPNLFTGFARSDRNLRVHQLLPIGYRVLDELGEPVLDKDGNPVVGTYKGPFPVICTAINLTTGEDLAYQERKAASFSFTPIFSGYNVGWTSARDHWNQFNGFVDTPSFVYQDAGSITLATACAISGAAASPDMGYHSNPAFSFLLTVFNVRLGWWLRNPRRRRIGRVTPYPIPPSGKPDRLSRLFTLKRGTLPSSPRFGLLRLVNELFGQSDDTTSYVYLTDGGHFDNMGLYELLRRRCRTIIVSDSEADPNLTFEGIGMAIRKARLDFGIEVTLDQTAPVPPERPAEQAVSNQTSSSIVSPPTQTGHDHPGAAASVSTDPPTPPAQALSQQKPPEIPYVLTGRVLSTDPPGFTATFAHQQPQPIVEGLSSFREYPSNSIHCVYGTIRYPEDSDPSQFGHILYIKASLTGDEPPDILNYRREHKKFPHDTTLNQFFTESQFESYRRLGEHIALSDETVISWMKRYLPSQ